MGRAHRLVSIRPLLVPSRSRHHSRGIRAKFSLVVVVNCIVKPFLVDGGARRLLAVVAFRRVGRLILVDCVLQRVKVRSEVIIKNFFLLAQRLTFTLVLQV